jgi:hypothetical protein
MVFLKPISELFLIHKIDGDHLKCLILKIKVERILKMVWGPKHGVWGRNYGLACSDIRSFVGGLRGIYPANCETST